MSLRATAWPRAGVFPALLEVVMACHPVGPSRHSGMRAVVPDLIDGVGSCLPVEKEETGTSRGLRHPHGGIEDNEERVPDIQSASGSRRFSGYRHGAFT